MQTLEIDKLGSATSPLGLGRCVQVTDGQRIPRAGDVVVVRALGESVTYGNLELPNGRLAKVNRDDLIAGVIGKRRALKGFVGEVPQSIKGGDRLHLLNLGGVIGHCTGHHSSLSDAIEVEVVGTAVDDGGKCLNIGDKSLPMSDRLEKMPPIVVVAGTCMNSGKTVAVTEIIKQAHHAGLKVAGAKLSGVACLRDTLNMQDHGAESTASFLDCGLPSTVDADDLPSVAKSILNHLAESHPDLIVVELGDGIVGGYSVDAILKDAELTAAFSKFVFCASDYVGVVGGLKILEGLGIKADVIAGSVTDSEMGEHFIEGNYSVKAGNARRDGLRLFSLLNVGKQ